MQIVSRFTLCSSLNREHKTQQFKKSEDISLKQSNSVEIELKESNNANISINYILVIDDNPHIRNAVKNSVEKILIERNILQMFSFLEGNDGIDILKYVIDAKYSQYIKLIITDENMEFMHGSAAIKIVRDFEKHNKVKKYQIFSATSYEDKHSESIIITAGADLILVKPFTKEKLLAALEKNKILEI